MPLRERQLIERVRRMAAAAKSIGRHSGMVRGMGDDCAVLRLPAGYDSLVTTDFTIEGVHFRREWQSAESVGHRSLARGLSDIAAMGGEPVAAFLSLGVSARVDQKWVDGFVRGFLRLARAHATQLAGGDVASSPDVVVADVMVLGKVRRGRAILRSGARPGDKLYVTGKLGAAGALLERLHRGARVPPDHRSLLPKPRIAVGRALVGLASACIDLSDGLSTDLMHICAESGVGAVVDADRIPRADGATLEHALHGGDDYELLFSARERIPARIAGVPLRHIGDIVKGSAVHISHGDEVEVLEPRGWEHFAKG